MHRKGMTHCPTCFLPISDPELFEVIGCNYSRSHRQVKQIIRPEPTDKFLKKLQSDKVPELVTWLSPTWESKQVYLRARQFRREFHYDFIQWGDPEDDPKAHGFLFNDDTGMFGHGAIVGACAFRWREWDDTEPGWALQWIWITPQARRKGVLTRRWNIFREMFGEFVIEPPLSEAMESFAGKHATPRQWMDE